MPWVGSLNRSDVLKTIRLMREHQYLGPVPADLERHLVAEPVPCMTFDELVRRHRVERIDFLNIDAEGADFEIFSSVDLDRHRPALLCIETSQMDERERREVQARLHAAGYAFLEIFDLFSECRSARSRRARGRSPPNGAGKWTGRPTVWNVTG